MTDCSETCWVFVSARLYIQVCCKLIEKYDKAHLDRELMLLFVAAYGTTGLVSQVLNKGVDVNVIDTFGNTALGMVDEFKPEEFIEIGKFLKNAIRK